MSTQAGNATTKLNVKDLITIGIFSALLFLALLIGGIPFGINPVTTFYMPIGSALLGGPILLLLVAKVRKRGAVMVAVMMRYVPVIFEDWQYIKDAMKMRDVTPSIKGLFTNPSMTVECVYVPLMMAASKTADELSIASVARGIENPNPRSSLIEIHFCIQDWIAVFMFLTFFIATLVVRGGFI